MTTLLAAFGVALAVWLWLPGAALARTRSGPEGQRPKARPREVLRRWWDRALAGQRSRGHTAPVSHVCELLALSIQAGAPPRSALAHVAGVMTGPPREHLDRVLNQISLGIDEPEAWLALAEAPGFRRVARDLSRSIRHGSVLADLLRRHAAEARSDAQAQALARARVAGVRSVVPLVVCFLPAFLLVGVVPALGSTVLGLLG